MSPYFPDTNLFLEFRKPADLPWHELNGKSSARGLSVHLLIPSRVIMQLERYKGRGNDRKTRRARDMSALFRKALDAADHVTEIRASDPRIVLELPKLVRIDFSKYPSLDPTNPDHAIIVEYAELLPERPGLRILTDDTLLVLAARSLGFEPVRIPPTWKLGPEKDERDAEIERLREEVKVYKQSAPDLKLSFVDGDGKGIDTLSARFIAYELTEEDVEAAVRALATRFPMETEFAARPRPPWWLPPAVAEQTWRPPTEQDIDLYKMKDYPDWLNALRKALPRLANGLNDTEREIEFCICIENAGFVNAAGVRLNVSAYDGILLLDSLSEEEMKVRLDLLTFPAPPRPPRGRYADQSWLPSISPHSPLALPSFDLPGPPDPNKFRFTDGRPTRPVQELELRCEAFQHQDEPRVLKFRLVLSDAFGGEGRLRVRVQASNLRRPIEKFLRIFAIPQRGDFITRLQEAKPAPKRPR